MNRSKELVDSSTCRLVSLFDFLSLVARVSTGSNGQRIIKEKSSTIIDGPKPVWVAAGFHRSTAIFPQTPTSGRSAALIFFIKRDPHSGAISLEFLILYSGGIIHHSNRICLSLIEIRDWNIVGMSQHSRRGV